MFEGRIHFHTGFHVKRKRTRVKPLLACLREREGANMFSLFIVINLDWVLVFLLEFTSFVVLFILFANDIELNV